MSRKESQSKKVETRTFDTEYSSGDHKKMPKTPKQYKEENNNVVDELSKELAQMGCIVDAVKRPSNICVEDCIYQESESENEAQAYNEDAYSDAFEECDEEEKEDKEKALNVGLDTEENPEKGAHSEDNSVVNTECNLKLSKSQSFASSKNVSMNGSSSASKYGSLPVPQTRRINMSFTNDRLRQIERHNHILLDKILSARHSRKSSIPARPAPDPQPGPALIATAAVHRKKQQRQIDRDNMILLRKIQQAKSSASSLRR